MCCGRVYVYSVYVPNIDMHLSIWLVICINCMQQRDLTFNDFSFFLLKFIHFRQMFESIKENRKKGIKIKYKYTCHGNDAMISVIHATHQQQSYITIDNGMEKSETKQWNTSLHESWCLENDVFFYFLFSLSITNKIKVCCTAVICNPSRVTLESGARTLAS